MKKYIVELTPEQRKELSEMIKSGKAYARELTHARILLKADAGQDGPGWNDAKIAEALEISTAQVARVRTRCAKASVQEAILPAKASRIRRRRLDGTKASVSDCPGVWCSPAGSGALDPAVARLDVGGTGLRRSDQPRNRAPDALGE